MRSARDTGSPCGEDVPGSLCSVVSFCKSIIFCVTALYHCTPSLSYGTHAKAEANPTLDAAYQSTTALLKRRPTACRHLGITQRP